MQNLSSYLEKFKKIRDPRDDKKAIVQAILLVTGREIDQSEFSINKRTLFLKCNPYLRNEIFAQKESILELIKKAGIKVDLTDIR